MDFFLELHRRNPILSVTGWLHLGLLVVALVALAFDTRLVTGINPWIKPIKFCLSVVVYVWSLGWLLAYLPPAVAPMLRSISWGVALTMGIEIACIFMQAARGVPSHFNITSAFDGAIFSLMGIVIMLNTAINVWALVLVWRHELAVAPAVAWGIRLGLLLFILGAVEGGLMAGRLAHTVGAPDGGPGLPGLNWSTRYGDLRVAHFVGMHALQGLPLVGWLLTRDAAASVAAAGLTAVWALAVGWALVTGWLLVRALGGTPLWAA